MSKRIKKRQMNLKNPNFNNESFESDLDLNEDGERGAEGSAEREKNRIHGVQCSRH